MFVGAGDEDVLEGLLLGVDTGIDVELLGSGVVDGGGTYVVGQLGTYVLVVVTVPETIVSDVCAVFSEKPLPIQVDHRVALVAPLTVP